MAILAFELNSLIHMTSADNRAVLMRVSKLQSPENIAAIDVIPKVRYKIPCKPYKHRTDLCSPQFFEAGLLAIPHISSDGLVRHVVVCNLGERINRLCSGYQLLSPPTDAATEAGPEEADA